LLVPNAIFLFVTMLSYHLTIPILPSVPPSRSTNFYRYITTAVLPFVLLYVSPSHSIRFLTISGLYCTFTIFCVFTAGPYRCCIHTLHNTASQALEPHLPFHFVPHRFTHRDDGIDLPLLRPARWRYLHFLPATVRYRLYFTVLTFPRYHFTVGYTAP